MEPQEGENPTAIPIAERTLVDLMESLYEVYDLKTFTHPGVRSNPEPIMSHPTIYIPNFGEMVDIEQIADTVTWSFTIPAEIEESISLTSSKRSTPRHLKYKLRHEFVAESLSTAGTDKQLQEEFPKIGDDDDVLTPDFIIRDVNGHFHVIEIGTSRSINLNAIRKVFYEKHFKYEQALVNRSTATDHPITYTPIVVAHNVVCSNIKLPDDLTNELIIRMRISIALENCALGKGFVIQKTEDDELLSATAEEIKVSLEAMEDHQKRHKEKIFINNQYIGKILQNPNDEAVASIYSFCRLSAKKEIFTKRNSVTDITDYIQDLNSVKDKRQDIKPVFGMPFLIPKNTVSSTVPLRWTQAERGPHAPLIKLWNEALDIANSMNTGWKEEDKEALLKEAMETNQSSLEEMIRKRHERRSKYHVVDLKKAMTPVVSKYLAKDGVMAKRYKDSEFLQLRKMDQKRAFSGITSTSDIKKFIENKEIYEESKDAKHTSQKKIIDLIEFANKISNNRLLDINVIKQWTDTKLFRYLDFISDVALELCISLKSNTNRDHFILKKLKFYDTYLLIKTTNSRSHIFCSLMFPTPNFCEFLDGSPFQVPWRTGSAYITPFSSFRADKLENIATAPARFLSMASFWCHFYEEDLRDFNACIKNTQLLQMLNLSVLIMLEDKAETEETITLTRYMYMEVFKGDLTIMRPDPFKMIEKFNSRPRSRLNLYLIKMIIENFSKMVNKSPEKNNPKAPIRLLEGEDVLPADEWVGLLNCFTSGMVTNATKAINLCYLGYLKNKNEVSQDNSDYKLIEKVLEEETTIDLEIKNTYYGSVPVNEIPKPKQFSSDAIIKGCQIMEGRLKNILGKEWKKIIELEILDKLSKCFTEEMATLKASSPFNHSKTPVVVTKKESEEIHRLKVIEAISINLEKFNINPMLNLASFIKLIEDSCAGVIADLFKKNQHGGLREIYVLSIESRVLQLYIETISRVLCSYFEEETLTHPENKLHLLDKHKVRSAKMGRALNSIYTDLCNSSDKKRWNQNFVMTSMCIPLFRLTTPIFHNSIKRILNLWADKLIKIPPAVCDLLMNKISLTSKVYMDLLENFWAPYATRPTRSYIMKLCGSFINTTSGMMQGILHYLSSLLHLTFLHAGTFYTKTVLRKLYPKNRFIMTQVCSSDDSATILSSFSEPDTENVTKESFRVYIDSEVSLLTLTYFCRFFCMRESTKSTIALPDYVEFNSEFMLRNTVAKPLIKLSAVCTCITESESFITRFHTMYNLISDLYSSGLPSLNTHMSQIAQAWIHYKTLGSSTNGLFDEWHKLIMTFPSCVHGFFLLDSDVCCGLLGYSFTRWMSIISNELLYNSVSALDYSELEPTPDGGVAPSLVVKHGDLKKWHTLMDRLDNGSLDPTNRVVTLDRATNKVKINEKVLKMRQDKINKNYEVLFRKALNIMDVKIKLLMKASMPGVARSLATGSPFMQALSMSVYALNTHCFTKTSLTYESTRGKIKKGKITEKLSLLLDLTRVIENNKDLKGLDNMKAKKTMEVMFPLIKRYEEAVQIIDSYRDASELPVHRIRQRKSIMVIQPRIIESPLSLIKVVSRIWFGTTVKCSDRVVNRCWDHYKIIYSWLHDSFDETLKEGPFQTPIELYYFVSRQDTKARKFMLNGPGIFSNIFSGQLEQIIRKHTIQNVLLDKGLKKEKRKTNLEASLAEISLATKIPIPVIREASVRKTLLSVPVGIDDIQSLALRPRRESKLLILSSYVKGQINMDQIVDILNQTGIGTLISFTKVQRKVGRGKSAKWKDDGECLAFTEGIMFKITIKDDCAISITTNNWRLLRTNPGILRGLMEDLNLRANKKPSFSIGAIAKFQGSRFAPQSSLGTPVFYDSELTKTFLEPKGLRFLIMKDKIGIYSKIRSSQKPVIEIRSNVRDCPMHKSDESGRSLWESWLEFKSASSASAYEFLKKVKQKIDESEPPSKEKTDKRMRSYQALPHYWDDLINWIKNTLESRLKYMGIGYTHQDFTTTVLESEVNVEDIDDDVLEDFLMDLIVGTGDEIGDELLGMFEGQMKKKEIDNLLSQSTLEDDIGHELIRIQESEAVELEDMFCAFSNLFHNWETEVTPLEPSVMRQTAFDYLYLHPLWDNLIQDCNSMDPMFFSKVLQGVISSSDEDFSKTLMKILGINGKGKELNITQRFAKLMDKMEFSDLPMDEAPGPSGLAKRIEDKVPDPWWDPEDSEDE